MSTKEPPYKDTERLTYRLLSAADETLYCDLYTDKQVMRHIAPPLTSAAAARSFRKALELTQSTTFKRRITVLIERATKQSIGISSIRLLDANRSAEVGSMLKPSAHMHGYGFEYSAALIARSFELRPVDLISAQVNAGNAPIEKLLTELGFTLAHAATANSAAASTRVWSVTRAAWEKRHSK